MRRLLVAAALAAGVFASSTAIAGRSGKTTITHLIVKSNHVAVYTATSNGDCSEPTMFILENSHANFDAMYRGFLASRLSGTKVDISGTNSCSSLDSRGETISWAYVAD
jgi:hypothetical protein